VDFLLRLWQASGRMPRRRSDDSEDPRWSGYSVASAVLRGLGRGLVLATVGLGVAAVLDMSGDVSIGTVVAAGVFGTGALVASAALRNEAWRQHQSEDGEARQSIGVLPLATSVAFGVDADAVTVAELQSDHVAWLIRQRAQREAGSGKGA
jgi:hypothetical protein